VGCANILKKKDKIICKRPSNAFFWHLRMSSNGIYQHFSEPFFGYLKTNPPHIPKENEADDMDYSKKINPKKKFYQRLALIASMSS
jgi:hypothetical protein